MKSTIKTASILALIWLACVGVIELIEPVGGGLGLIRALATGIGVLISIPMIVAMIFIIPSRPSCVGLTTNESFAQAVLLIFSFLLWGFLIAKLFEKVKAAASKNDMADG